MLLPALSRAKQKAQGIQCLSNHRQMALGWRMYADDNSDRMVYASGDTYAQTLSDEVSDTANGSLNAYAWTLSQMDFSPANQANYDPAIDIMTRPLWKYLRSASLYRCPADHSYVAVNGVNMPRLRTISMNFYLGGFMGSDEGVDPNYAVYLKTSDLSSTILSPGPAKTWVFLDEREDCVNWGNYACDMAGYPGTPTSLQGQYEFEQDVPACYHNLAAGFSFADGHSEIHRWLDGRTMPPMHYQQAWYQSAGALSVPFDRDVGWLQDHSTRPAQR